MKFSAGFTIVELLMVILLVGILSAVAIPQFIDFRTDARITMTREKLNDYKLALIGDSRQMVDGRPVKPGFIANMGTVPASLNDLVTQGSQAAYNPLTKFGWNGPYLNSTDANWNRDSWGTALQYTAATRTLRSCGPDRVCGNADDIALTF